MCLNVDRNKTMTSTRNVDLNASPCLQGEQIMPEGDNEL